MCVSMTTMALKATSKVCQSFLHHHYHQNHRQSSFPKFTLLTIKVRGPASFNPKSINVLWSPNQSKKSPSLHQRSRYRSWHQSRVLMRLVLIIAESSSVNMMALTSLRPLSSKIELPRPSGEASTSIISGRPSKKEGLRVLQR
jgi:hypothetical protein